MNLFQKIDMREVTRLTRAGKLADAMVLLRAQNPYSVKVEPQPSGITPVQRNKVDSEIERPSTRFDASNHFRSGSTRSIGPQSLQGILKRVLTLGSHLARTTAFVEGAPQFAEPRQQAPVASPGASFEERIFSNQAGTRTYKVYVPSAYAGQALPVVIMLHGCTQNPDDFAAGTRMNELAEMQRFLVVYPNQPQSANMQKCWNWFNTADQQRDSGEPALIAGITRQVIEDFSADASRVYVAGLSAGGAAAAIMTTRYPDLFAAAGVHSGLACGAAKNMASAFAAMAGRGTIRTSDGPVVPTIVFHGDADRTVNAANGDQLVSQIMPAAGLTSTKVQGIASGGMKYTKTVHHAASGRAVIEQWILHGAGHAWSGGSHDGSFTDPKGPDASREMIRFFLSQRISNEQNSRLFP